MSSTEPSKIIQIAASTLSALSIIVMLVWYLAGINTKLSLLEMHIDSFEANQQRFNQLMIESVHRDNILAESDPKDKP